MGPFSFDVPNQTCLPLARVIMISCAILQCNSSLNASRSAGTVSEPNNKTTVSTFLLQFQSWQPGQIWQNNYSHNSVWITFRSKTENLTVAFLLWNFLVYTCSRNYILRRWDSTTGIVFFTHWQCIDFLCICRCFAFAKATTSAPSCNQLGMQVAQ